MDIKELEKRIGQKCEVIDPSSKKKEFEPATVAEIDVRIKRAKSGGVKLRTIYLVYLDRLTTQSISGKPYHNSIFVAEPDIRFPDRTICPCCGGTGANPDLFNEIGSCTCGADAYNKGLQETIDALKALIAETN